MAVFTFVCKHDGDSWSAKQHPASSDGGSLEGSADSSFDLQRLLTKLSLSSGAAGSVSSSFAYITPKSAVFQVIIGGGGGGGFISGGGVASGGGGGGAAAAAAPAAEEKKEEVKEKEEESDEDMGFSLFD